MMSKRFRTTTVFAIALACLALSSQSNARSQITIHSPAFEEGKEIPSKYTCSGQDLSPPLKWESVPSEAKSLALIVSDPDAPRGTFIHWVVYNLPARLTELGEDILKEPVVKGGGQQGKNDADDYGYHGPCPPPGAPHHYHFKIYALDSDLQLQSGATAADVEKAMKGHVLATGELVGIFGR